MKRLQEETNIDNSVESHPNQIDQVVNQSKLLVDVDRVASHDQPMYI